MLSVTFAPALGASGTVSGSIALTDTASVSQQILDVKGTSTLPLTFAPTALTFPAQTVATTSVTQTVTLTNNLATSLSPTIVGNGDFAAVAGGATPCGSTLLSHASCTFTVAFRPSVVGSVTSAVTVTDSANPNVQTLNVTGTGQ
jgi:hypothetical protein